VVAFALNTACRVMAKRLRDVCGLPKSELALMVEEILDEQIAKKLV
jgi:hypothetical protein